MSATKGGIHFQVEVVCSWVQAQGILAPVMHVNVLITMRVATGVHCLSQAAEGQLEPKREQGLASRGREGVWGGVWRGVGLGAGD